MKAVLYFDGSNDPKQRRLASWGYVLEIEGRDPIEGQGQCKESYQGVIFPQTNNVGEYSGLCNGLARALEEGVTDLEVIGDSQLVIYQLTGKYKVNTSKFPHLGILNKAAANLIAKFPNIVLNWQRQDKNKADAVSRVTKKGAGIQRSNKSATGKITHIS